MCDGYIFKVIFLPDSNHILHEKFVSWGFNVYESQWAASHIDLGFKGVQQQSSGLFHMFINWIFQSSLKQAAVFETTLGAGDNLPPLMACLCN